MLSTLGAYVWNIFVCLGYKRLLETSASRIFHKMDSSLNKSLIINDVTTSVAPEEAEKALMNSLRLTVGILMTVAISSIMINSGML